MALEFYFTPPLASPTRFPSSTFLTRATHSQEPRALGAAKFFLWLNHHRSPQVRVPYPFTQRHILIRCRRPASFSLTHLRYSMSITSILVRRCCPCKPEGSGSLPLNPSRQRWQKSSMPIQISPVIISSVFYAFSVKSTGTCEVTKITSRW